MVLSHSTFMKYIFMRWTRTLVLHMIFLIHYVMILYVVKTEAVSRDHRAASHVLKPRLVHPMTIRSDTREAVLSCYRVSSHCLFRLLPLSIDLTLKHSISFHFKGSKIILLYRTRSSKRRLCM